MEASLHQSDRKSARPLAKMPKIVIPRKHVLMNAQDVRQKLKELMIEELNLEGRTPADIDDAAPLFGEGLGLDSLDALQLAMSVEEQFGVRIPEGDEAR